MCTLNSNSGKSRVNGTNLKKVPSSGKEKINAGITEENKIIKISAYKAEVVPTNKPRKTRWEKHTDGTKTKRLAVSQPQFQEAFA